MKQADLFLQITNSLHSEQAYKLYYKQNRHTNIFDMYIQCNNIFCKGFFSLSQIGHLNPQLLRAILQSSKLHTIKKPCIKLFHIYMV